MKNAILRNISSDLRDFFYSLNEPSTMKRIYVENEFGWQLAIPVYSNNGDYGFHVISLVNVKLLGAPEKSRIGPLKEMMNALLPKLPIPGYLIEGHTRVFVVDEISGKFLKAKFNQWKNEAFLFFKAKVWDGKGLSNMPIMLRIASILSSFFGKRAERMREVVEAKGRELYGTWKDITNLLEQLGKRLRTWVDKFADTSRWDSRERFEVEEKAEEKAQMEEARREKDEKLKLKKPGVIADLLAKLAWLTDSDLTVDKVDEIGKIEEVDWFASFKRIDWEAKIQGCNKEIMCYG